MKEDEITRDINVYSSKGYKMENTTSRRAKFLVKRREAFWLDKETIVVFFDKRQLRRTKESLLNIENTCYLCGEKKDNLTLDHIIPSHSAPSSNDDINLELACSRCNAAKKNLDLMDFLELVKQDREKYYYIKLERLAELEKIYNRACTILER